MRMQEEQIRNVAKIFEAFARAIAKRDNIKIESLDGGGEIYEIYSELYMKFTQSSRKVHAFFLY